MSFEGEDHAKKMMFVRKNTAVLQVSTEQFYYNSELRAHTVSRSIELSACTKFRTIHV
jgi:hypothetical protein